MGSHEEYFRVSFHIQQTIQRSKYTFHFMCQIWGIDIFTFTLHRVLLTTIKFLRGCLCPCCLVKKGDVYKMGMKLDMKSRLTKQCVDDFRRQRSIEEARNLIFQLGVPVGRSRVKAILDEASYVSICVSRATYSTYLWLIYRVRMLFQKDLGTICHFHSNASTMKKLAARDFEDLLQVSQFDWSMVIYF